MATLMFWMGFSLINLFSIRQWNKVERRNAFGQVPPEPALLIIICGPMGLLSMLLILTFGFAVLHIGKWDNWFSRFINHT